jgi:hypothetical protein
MVLVQPLGRLPNHKIQLLANSWTMVPLEAYFRTRKVMKHGRSKYLERPSHKNNWIVKKNRHTIADGCWTKFVSTQACIK